MPATVEIPAAKHLVLAVEPRIYDAPTRAYRSNMLYFTSPKELADSWVSAMLMAQRSGLWVPLSAEWYQGRDCVLERYGEAAEKDFVGGAPEWTGTVLDYEHEELLESIRFREDVPEDEILEDPYSCIKSATRLGAKDGFFLPDKGGEVKALSPRYRKTIQQLWGLGNPEKLPDHAYLGIYANGFRPVVRGLRDWLGRGGRRVDVAAHFGPASRGFAARFVTDIGPKNAITPAEYRELEVGFAREEAEAKALMEARLKPLREELDAAIVLLG